MSGTACSRAVLWVHRGHDLDSMTQKTCPCRKCHGDGVRLRVIEAAYGSCVECIWKHGQTYDWWEKAHNAAHDEREAYIRMKDRAAHDAEKRG